MDFMATQLPSIPPVSPAIRTPDDGDSLVLERRRQRLQPPRMYQVVMLNDDFTPMEFVIAVLQELLCLRRLQPGRGGDQGRAGAAGGPESGSSAAGHIRACWI